MSHIPFSSRSFSNISVFIPFFLLAFSPLPLFSFFASSNLTIGLKRLSFAAWRDQSPGRKRILHSRKFAVRSEEAYRHSLELCDWFPELRHNVVVKFDHGIRTADVWHAASRDRCKNQTPRVHPWWLARYYRLSLRDQSGWEKIRNPPRCNKARGVVFGPIWIPTCSLFYRLHWDK